MILVAAPPRPRPRPLRQTVACMGRSVSPSFLVNWALYSGNVPNLYETINMLRSSSMIYYSAANS
jgi:hypothetical protein